MNPCRLQPVRWPLTIYNHAQEWTHVDYNQLDDPFTIYNHAQEWTHVDHNQLDDPLLFIIMHKSEPM